MMQEEFEERIGLKITAEEYAEIEPLYVGDPKNRDKNAFCKHWLKDGGLQWLFDKRQGEINLKKMRLAELQEDLESRDRWIDDMGRELSEKNRQIVTLENSLKRVRELVA